MTTVDSGQSLASSNPLQRQHTKKTETSHNQLYKTAKASSKIKLRLLLDADTRFLKICRSTYRRLPVCKHVPSRSRHRNRCSMRPTYPRMPLSTNPFPTEPRHRRSHRPNPRTEPSRPSSALRYIQKGLQFGFQSGFENPGSVCEA